MATHTFQLLDARTNQPFTPDAFKEFVLEHIRSGVITVSANELFNEIAAKRNTAFREFRLIIKEIHFGEPPQMVVMDSRSHVFCIIRLNDQGVYLELTE